MDKLTLDNFKVIEGKSKIPYDKFSFTDSKDSFTILVKDTKYTFQVSEEGRNIYSIPLVRDENYNNEFPNGQPSVYSIHCDATGE